MSPRPSTLLGLVLCLGQMIHMQEGLLPKPVLWAEPSPVVPRGWPVTFVCSFPVWAEFSRLEKDGKYFQGQKSVSQDGSQVTEARFHFPAVSDDMAGSYRCRYHDVYERWSELSEFLLLQVTEEDPTPPSGGSRGRHLYWEVQGKRPATDPAFTLLPIEVTTLPGGTASQTDPASRDYRVENSIRLGLAGVVLLILVAILVEAGLSQCRSPRGSQE